MNIEINSFNDKQLDNNIEFKLKDLLKEYKEYIMTYDKNNRKDISKFLESFSSYNWLNQNGCDIKDLDDYDEKIELSFLIVNDIKLIANSSDNLLEIKKNIREYLDNNQILTNGILKFDFDTTLSTSVKSIRDKVYHDERYLNSLKTSMISKKNRM